MAPHAPIPYVPLARKDPYDVPMRSVVSLGPPISVSSDVKVSAFVVYNV